MHRGLSCGFCGSRNTEFFSTQKDKKEYFKCLNCGYVFLNPDLRPLPDKEKNRYLLHNNSIDNFGYRKWLESFIEFSLKTAGIKNGCRVLDFGSGPEPVLAKLLSAMGFNVSTEDIFFAPGRRDGPFSLITAVEVFEHLSEPGKVLKDLASRLDKNGKICISTEFLPEKDFESWYYRMDFTHIGFFPLAAFYKTAGNYGLKVLDTDRRHFIVLSNSK